MKFRLKITKDILKKSAACGCGSFGEISDSCAFAVAFNELIPKVNVGTTFTIFSDKDGIQISYVLNSDKQRVFINDFDFKTYTDRLEMPEQEFDIEIPDNVIEYYYQDYAVLADKIANSKIFQSA